MRLFFDTNVLIDAFTRRPPDGDGVLRLAAMSALGDAEAWVSAKSYTDAFYVLAKEMGSEAVHDAFHESFEWLNVCSVDEADIKLATERRWGDFEDCLIAVGAEKVKADILVTRDLNGFLGSRTPAFTPQQLFDHLESRYGIVYDVVDW